MRVNALGTEWGYADIVAVGAAGVDGLMIPKVESPDEVTSAEWVLGALERERGIAPLDVIPLMRRRSATLGLRPSHGQAGACAGSLWGGGGDFTLDLGMTWTRDELELLLYRSHFVSISRAAGLAKPLDTVWTDLRDPDGFERSAMTGRALGQGGKMCIHPDQVSVANRAFSPAAEAVVQAKRVVAAFEEAEAKGLASIQLEEKYIDYPIVHAARETLAQADAIASPEKQAT